jgi:predicted metal-dependent phosphoesterase TrpH
MLKFARNKLVNIHRSDEDALVSHGVLDDDIYSLELDVSLRISDLEILSVAGKWHRWTTPECPRATDFLRDAVGLRVDEEGFAQTVHKVVGRRACRHYANLLLECCDCAKEAAMLARWEDAKAGDPDLSLEAFLDGEFHDAPRTPQSRPVRVEEIQPRKDQAARDLEAARPSGGMVIDLHVHTSPASPCSSVAVEDLIEDAKRIGLDGICLTDHNHVWDPKAVENLRQKHGFLVLRGNEVITDQGDMLVFGLDRDIDGIIALRDLRQEVTENDGFIIVPHPFRGFLTFGMSEVGLTPEKAMERPLFRLVDAVEVLNGKVTDKENAFAAEVTKGLGLPGTGGSDAHELSEVGVYATQFADVIRNEEELVDSLRRGDFSPVVFRKERRLGLGHP